MKHEKEKVLYSKKVITDDVSFKRQRWILIAVVVSAVVESITLLAVSWSWRSFRQDLVKPREQQLCWELFIPENDDDDTTEFCHGYLEEEIKEKTKTTRCCGTMQQFMDRLAAKNLFKRYNSDINPDLSQICLNRIETSLAQMTDYVVTLKELASLDLTSFNCKISNNKQPFVRVTDIANDKKPVQVGTWSKLFWNPGAPSSTMSTSGLRYLADDGTIYVEEADFYFVSLELKTKIIKANAGNGVDGTIRHSVHLISNGTQAVILEDARTVCETSTHEAESTSVLGAMFKLEYGDRLYVATSHPQYIAPDPHTNYFTVHRI